MKRKYLKNIIITLLVSIVVFSCGRKDDDFNVKAIGYASSNFVYNDDFDISTDKVDFQSVDSLGFTGSFNEEVEYTITISGKESGAVKKVKGISNNLSNAKWDGSAELTFFITETCDIELKVLGKDEILASKEVVVEGTYTPKGTLIANLETSGFYKGHFDVVELEDNTISGYIRAGAIEFADTLPELEGNRCFILEGKDVKHTGGFIGLAYNNPKQSLNDINDDKYYDIATTDADSLYFNVFIYGEGDKNAACFLKFMQDDDNDEQHDGKRENGFEWQIKDLSHTGWKLFSIKYSDIKLGGNSDFGGSGDGIHRPNNIVQIEFALWGLKQSTPVKFIFDYPIFTVGKSFGQ